MRLAFIGGFFFAACLPTKFQPYYCTSDQECLTKARVSQGLRCDEARQVCVCDGLGFPGCESSVDGGSGGEGGVDGSTVVDTGSVDDGDDLAGSPGFSQGAADAMFP